MSIQAGQTLPDVEVHLIGDRIRETHTDELPADRRLAALSRLNRLA